MKNDGRRYKSEPVAYFGSEHRHIDYVELLTPIIDYIVRNKKELSKYGIPCVEVSISGGGPDSDDTTYEGWDVVTPDLIKKIQPHGSGIHVNAHMKKYLDNN